VDSCAPVVACGNSEKPPDFLAGGGVGVSCCTSSVVLAAFGDFDLFKTKNHTIAAIRPNRSINPKIIRTTLNLPIVEGCAGGGRAVPAGGT